MDILSLTNLFTPFDSAGLAAVTFEEDLRAYLAGLGVVAYPGHVPQKAALPATTYFLVSEDPRYTVGRSAGLSARSYQFSVFSRAYTDTLRGEDALRKALDGYRGPMGSHFVTCRMVNCLDQYEPAPNSTDAGTYQRIVEYRIFFNKAVATF